MIIRNYVDLKSALDAISRSPIIAYDTETTGLNTRKDRVIGFGFATSETESFYVPLLEWNGTELIEVPNSGARILEALKDKQLICYNSAFDIDMTKNSLGIELLESLYADVMLLKHTVDEERPFGLKDVAKAVFGAAAAQEQEDLKTSIKANGGSVNEYYKADMSILAKYCEQDCKLTLKLYHHYSKILKSENLVDFFYKDEVMPLYKEVTIPMQRRGIKLDLDLIKQAKVDIESEITRIACEIQEDIKPHLGKFRNWYLNKNLPPSRSGTFAQYVLQYSGLELPKTKTGKIQATQKNLISYADKGNKFAQFVLGHGFLTSEEIRDVQELWYLDNIPESGYMFNLSSKHHLKKLFFETLSEEPVSRTDLGNPQVDDEFLDIMANKYEWASKLREYNKLIKLHGTYIVRFLDEQDQGIFYPSFQQHRTISGRYGSDLQQLPRPIEVEAGQSQSVVERFTNLIRKFFISRPGCSFIDNDYESLEPHVFAHVSGDDGLRAIFETGFDFYSTIAIKTEKLENVSADKSADNYLGKVHKTLRQKAKAYSLGIPYGMSPYALSKTLNIDESEAVVLYEDYLNAFPNLRKWMDRTLETVKLTGQIRSEAGRIRHLPVIPKLYHTYSDKLLDSLYLYKTYGDNFSKYEQVKYLRKQYVNGLNNSLNFQIQSLSASIVNRSAIAINRALKFLDIEGGVVAQIHDQLVVEVPESFESQAIELITDIMENTYKLSISLRAPAMAGKNFADAH